MGVVTADTLPSKPRSSRTRHCSAIALTARHSPAPRSACTPSRGKTLSGCSRANRKSTSRPPKAETRGHRRFARNMERISTRRPSEQDDSRSMRCVWGAGVRQPRQPRRNAHGAACPQVADCDLLRRSRPRSLTAHSGNRQAAIYRRERRS